MGYLVFDTETTGLPDWNKPAEANGQPRLASWCMIFVDRDFHAERMFSALVKPDGWEMPAEAAAINGLTTQRLQAEGHSIEWPLSLMLAALDAGRTLVAHNLSFDAKIMRGELRRAGFGRDAVLVSEAQGICTMRGLTDACALLSDKMGNLGRYKFPRLAEASRIILNKELEGAHGAQADAICCHELLAAMAQRGLLGREAA